VLPGVLEDVVALDPVGGLGADLHLAPLGQAGDPGGEVGGGARGGEGPAAAPGGVDLGRPDQGRPAVDADVDGDGRVDPREALVQLGDLRQELERRAGGVERVPAAAPLAWTCNLHLFW
jgi:hypothetical protein